MKILYIHQYFNTPQMSGGTRSYEMARRLVESGHKVDMITSERQCDGKGWRISQESGINVHWCPVPYANGMSITQRMRAFAKFAWCAMRRAAQIECDVILATSTPLTIAIPALYAKWRRRVPMVFEVRDLWPDVPIAMGGLKNPVTIAAARWLERRAYLNSAQIIALSPEMRDGVLRQGIAPNLISVIPNSSDIDLFDVPESCGRSFREKYGWLGNRPLIVYTGTLGKANGVDYLVRAAARATAINPEIRFLIVGSGAEQDSIQSLAAELGVLDRSLFMLPPVSKAEMPAVLSAADLTTSLFINLPELRANSPNKLFDSLAAGRPVAINNDGWMGDLIRERGFGLCLPPDQPESAAEMLVSSLEDSKWLAGARAAARSAARELFDRDLLARQLEQVLLSSIDDQPRSLVSVKRAA